MTGSPNQFRSAISTNVRIRPNCWIYFIDQWIFKCIILYDKDHWMNRIHVINWTVKRYVFSSRTIKRTNCRLPVRVRKTLFSIRISELVRQIAQPHNSSVKRLSTVFLNFGVSNIRLLLLFWFCKFCKFSNLFYLLSGYLQCAMVRTIAVSW